MLVPLRHALAVVAVLVVHASAATLSSSIPSELAPLADGLALSIGRALPVTAASAGFGYVYDPQTNVFERRTPILGQLFIEKADTIGAGRWQIAAGWQRVAVRVWRGLLAFANVLLPLNRDGFRADVVPFAGLEASF